MKEFAVIADKLIALIEAIAWPAVVFGFLYLFRDELKKVLKRLSEIKGPGFEASLENDIEEAEEQAASVSLPERGEIELIDAPTDDPFSPTEVTFSRYRELAKIVPRAAIIEAWGKVVESARETVRRSGRSVQSETTASPLIELLHAEGVIDMHSVGLLHNLRRIRNKAAGPTQEYEVSEEDAERYIRIAERMMGHLMNVGRGDN